MKRTKSQLSLVVAFLLSLSLACETIARGKSLPDSLTAAIVIKVLAFESSERESTTLRIHILDNDNLATQFESFVGTSVRSRTLEAVTRGPTVPEEGVDVVIASGEAGLRQAISLAERYRAITVTNNPQLTQLAVSLTVFDDEGLPGILLDKKGARREGLYWEPEILQIAKIVE